MPIALDLDKILPVHHAKLLRPDAAFSREEIYDVRGVHATSWQPCLRTESPSCSRSTSPTSVAMKVISS